MDFRLPWGENIRQKWEQISMGSVIIQNTCTCVDAVGEQFRKVIDELDDWFTTSVEARNSELPLKHDARSEVHESRIEPVDNLPNEEIASAELDAESASTATGANTSRDVTDTEECVPESKLSAEDTSERFSVGVQENFKDVSFPVEPLSDDTDRIAFYLNVESCSSLREYCSHYISTGIIQDSGHENACEVDKKSLFSTSTEVAVTDCLDDNHVENMVASHVNSGSIPMSVDEDRLSESCQVDVIEKEPMISLCNSSADAHGFFRGYFDNKHEQQSEPNTVFPTRLLEIESLDGFFSKEALKTHDVHHLDGGFAEGYEDVILEDFWDNAESYELELLSNQAVRNSSYKKKLKNAIVSKLLSRKGYKKVWDHNLQAGKKLETGALITSVSGAATSRETSSLRGENDWEIL